MTTWNKKTALTDAESEKLDYISDPVKGGLLAAIS